MADFFQSFSTSQLVGLGLVLCASKLYMNHQEKIKRGEQSPFRLFGGYPNVSAFKHDVFKVIVTDLIPFILLTKDASSLFDTTNFFDSIIGRIVMVFSSYLVFYHLVEPYIANKTEIF